MKKNAIAVVALAVLLTLSSCGRTTKDVPLALEDLIGEYEYSSDDGAGKLTIKKTAGGYDISDYVSEISYRFLADSSNVETTKNNRIYIKYPEQVFSDDTVIFSYYILEYTSSGLDVYYGKSSPEDARFLYHATRK
ncbi:MAG: hypothetical protein HFF72_04940 [Oscillospiraceae bacterium]|jgi:hypothetical protein|nr:hypothetical protein [Oscillospiraceae bacterium]